MFGFGGRKDADVDELTIEHRVQDALLRLQTTGEPGLGIIRAPDIPEASGLPDAAGTDATPPSDPRVDYVVEALGAEGVMLDPATVARVLTLGHEFSVKTAPENSVR